MNGVTTATEENQVTKVQKNLPVTPSAEKDSEPFLPFAVPSIGEDEIAEVCDTLRSGWLTTGPKAKRFEEEFAEFVGARHAIAVNSATAGLHLALEAIGIGPGDKVLTTTHTFTATGEVIRYLGADPVFVDIDPDTMNIDVDCLQEKLAQDPAIKAIMPVHIAGQACEMDRILAIAAEANVRVVEDAAHALPTSYKGQMVGSIGDISVFSFYVTKTLVTGEGGMITTDDPDLAARMKVMRLHGISKDVFDRYRSRKPAWFYEVIAPGFKYNMPDIAAAIGLHQLKKQEAMRLAREAIAGRYTAAFERLPVKTPFVARAQDTHAWHLYILRINTEQAGVSRDQFIEAMAERGIGTSVHFIPLHMHPYWRDRYNLRREDFPNSSSTFEQIVSLPIYPSMTEGDTDRVIRCVRNILEESMARK